MSHDEESDDDWFNKDEEELLKDLKIKTNENTESQNTEYIRTSSDNKTFLLNQRLNAAANIPAAKTSKRIPTSDFRKILQSDEPMEIFLFAFTQENSDFFENQIAPNDSIDRVCLYMRILTVISDLKIPGFQDDIIKQFSLNDELLNHLRVIATKMFTQPYKKLWATEHDKMRFHRTLCDMKILLVQAYTFQFITPTLIDCTKHILTLIEQDTVQVDTPACAEFAEELKNLRTSKNAEEMVEKTFEIYPSLDDLLQTTSTTTASAEQPSLLNYEYKSVRDYLNVQMQTLRDDFMISLSSCVQELKKHKKLSQRFAGQVLLLEKVQIVLNEKFLNARRHEMLFIDTNVSVTNSKEKNRKQKPAATLKTGTLICLTTSYEFNSLILAVVTHQDVEVVRNGYIAIEVVRQFNIGNIYNKELLMFTSPAFFEPYYHVFKYLSMCSVEDFPMKNEIIFGASNSRPPSYIKHETVFKTDRKKFKPMKELPSSDLPLNICQRKAVQQALTQSFSLIQGPPGTGKTHTSVQLIKLLVDNETPKPIIVVAYTNESLDKFLLKISTYTRSIIRVGSQSRLREIERFNVPIVTSPDIQVNPRLKRLYFIIKTNYKAAFEELQILQNEFDGTEEAYQIVLKAQQKVRDAREKLNTMRLLFQYYVVRSHSIVALTTTGAAKNNTLLRLLRSGIVLFEEAGEILESHVLACLTPHIEHVVMIGDHSQLKPYTNDFQHSRSCDLNISLFERLILRKVLIPEVLLTQYRMRPIIAELLCPLFYETLHNDDCVEQYPPIRQMKHNLFFVKHSVEESRYVHDQSFFNKYEADKLILLAVYLTKEANYELDDIVILTPYAGQVKAIKNKLPPNIKLLRVMTVDSFQGLESNIVLLSLVRCNKERSIGFLNEKNRVCVALSRAKHGLYMIGDLDLLASQSDTWRSIESKLNSGINLIGEKFPYEKKKTMKINVKD